jgi:hypothetical protein
MPSKTKIVGQGRATVLYPNQSYSGDVLEMGKTLAEMNASSCTTTYSGISIENLKIEQVSTTNAVNGIINDCAQEASYVNNINLFNLGFTGLLVGTGATDSGPYNNVNFTAVNFSGTQTCDGVSTPCPVCANIQAQTRGLHGMTCIGNYTVSHNTVSPPSFPTAGIYVNWGFNSLEDIHVESFWDGIRVGDTSATFAGPVAVSNITVADDQNVAVGGPVINAIPICGSKTSSSSEVKCSVNTAQSINDVTLTQINDIQTTGTSTSGTDTVEDDTTGTYIASDSTGATLIQGLYALGESLGGGYSLFAFNPPNSLSAVPSWGVGNKNLGSGTTSCAVPGAVYSNTAATSSNQAMFICQGTTSSWQPIF